MRIRHIVLVIGILVAAVGLGFHGARQTTALRTELEAVRLRETPLAQEIEQLTRERDEIMRLLAPLRATNEQLMLSNAGLPRLRGEISRLRRETREFAQLKTTVDAMSEPAKKWSDGAARWKQVADQRTELKIPEFQFLTEEDWLSMGDPGWPTNSENDVRMGMAFLRAKAKSHFFPRVAVALNEYIAAHGGQLPNDILQLKPYFNSPVDDSVLERYKLLHTGKLSDFPESESLLTERAPVDDEYDFISSAAAFGGSSWGIGKLTGTGGSWKSPTNIITRLKPFAK